MTAYSHKRCVRNQQVIGSSPIAGSIFSRIFVQQCFLWPPLTSDTFRPIIRVVSSQKKPLDLIVRRGALRRFHKLKAQTVDLPVNVTWDRRQDDRRSDPNAVSMDRRAPDRRQKPPFTWVVSDFVVVAKPRKGVKRR
jgi:hypothetical protein